MYSKERGSIVASFSSKTSRSIAHCFEHLARVQPIIKGYNRVFEFLEGLVPFAGDENGVAGAGQAQDRVNRSAAVQFDAIATALHSSQAGLNLRRDLVGGL